jgi:hypothetical protein
MRGARYEPSHRDLSASPLPTGPGSHARTRTGMTSESLQGHVTPDRAGQPTSPYPDSDDTAEPDPALLPPRTCQLWACRSTKSAGNGVLVGAATTWTPPDYYARACRLHGRADYSACEDSTVWLRALFAHRTAPTLLACERHSKTAILPSRRIRQSGAAMRDIDGSAGLRRPAARLAAHQRAGRQI